MNKKERGIEKMRKTGTVIATVLALMMTFTAAASEDVYEYREMGFNLPLTQEMTDTTGFIIPYPIGSFDDDHHAYEMVFYYEAMPAKEAEKLLFATELTDEEKKALREVMYTIGVVLAGDVDFDTIKAKYEEINDEDRMDFDKAQEVGSADGFTFYFVPPQADEEYLSEIEKKYADELQNLRTVLPEALKGAEFFEPLDRVKEMVGGKIEFTATDLDGNTVTSEELFSRNEITMINCWGTWCHNCVDEMEELARIHTNMQEKGCGIVGMEWERKWDDASRQSAKELMEEWGTNYPNVIMPDEFNEQLNGYPTSIFVDKEGNVLEMPIVGAAVGKYESRLEALLSGEEAAPETAAEVDVVVVYHVNITDEDGPVEEVSIQFCNEGSCRFEETDENGTATFEVPAGFVYDVHVVEVPDGYEEDETVYHTTEGSGDVDIQLKKSE